MHIEKMMNNINCLDDFVLFLRELSDDYIKNKEEWENWTISDYLESISAWVKDFSACPNNNIDWANVDYKTVAQIFLAGKYYE